MKDLLEVIRDRGLKKTPARTAILAVFHAIDTPVDVDTIYESLKQNSTDVDRVTVYRTLNTLTEYGILKKVEFHEGKYRYELASLPHHHHLVCTECGLIQDIQECGMKQLEDKLQKRTSFTITQHNAEFFGLCPECQRNQAPSQGVIS